MRSFPLTITLVLCGLLAGCGTHSTPVRPGAIPPGTDTTRVTPTLRSNPAASLSLSAPAFAQGASIPAKYTCTGENISPALAWTSPPAGTKSLALIMDDPDAPGGTWVHWVLYNLPPETRGLAEGASKTDGSAAGLPAGTAQGLTSFGRPGYGGPCPPSGQHHYYFHLYAADTLFDNPSLDKAGLLKALEGHILANAEWMGVYQK